MVTVESGRYWATLSVSFSVLAGETNGGPSSSALWKLINYWNWVFHTAPLTTQSWHLPSWSPINSLEMCISLTASSYKQFPAVDKIPLIVGSKFVNKFWVLIQGKFKSWKLEAHETQFWGIIMGDYTQSIICQFMQVGKWQKLTGTKLPATTDMIYTVW